MKRIALLFICIILFGSLSAEYEQMQNVAVHAAAQYLDLLCMDTLLMLQQVARSPEAQIAKWETIYPQLETISQRLPGVYFFVLPDGNYYSVEKGFTNLNLSNRPYFESLFAGNDVLGYEIYSRSTGKKSAVMAAPIRVGNRTVGALGASLYLDELHARINAELMIPEDYTWFVVNNQGLTMLDQDLDYIFMNALTQGTPSLTNAIRELLDKDEGSIEYDLGNSQRVGRFAKLPNLDWRLILVKKGEAEVTATEDISLKVFGSELQQELQNMDDRTKSIIRDFKGNWDKETDVRSALLWMLDQPMVVDAAFVNEKGIIKYIEPGEYRNQEGADISTQEHVIQLRKQQKPVFSSVFKSVEGFSSISIAYPVFEGKSKLKGSISLLINPQLMIEGLLKNVNIPQNHEVWIMQKDGMMIYDQDIQEIGRNLFSDPMYKEYDSLQKLAKSIASQESGIGEYVFRSVGHLEKVLKKASWLTVRLHNQEWRVVVAQEI